MYYIKLSKRRGSSTTCVQRLVGSTESSPASVTQGINIISNRTHPSFDRPGKGSPEKTRRELGIEGTIRLGFHAPPQESQKWYMTNLWPGRRDSSTSHREWRKKSRSSPVNVSRTSRQTRRSPHVLRNMDVMAHNMLCHAKPASLA